VPREHEHQQLLVTWLALRTHKKTTDQIGCRPHEAFRRDHPGLEFQLPNRHTALLVLDTVFVLKKT
jgi:hypothetical protein